MALLVALLAALALVAAACSDDESSGGDEDAIAEAESDEDAEGDGDADGLADFGPTVAAATASLETAEDACDVVDALNAVVRTAEPSNAEEAAAAVDYYVTLLGAMADTSSDPEMAEALRQGAEGFAAYAEDVGNDLDDLDFGGDGPPYEGAEEANAAIDQWFNSEMAACMTPEGVPGELPEPEAQPSS